MLLQLPSSSRVRSLVPSTPAGASAGAELVTSDGRQLAFVSACLHGDIQGGIARLVLEQRFENHYDELLRVTYRMPLPADGAVSGYAFVIGERTITGVVDRKRAARERFERAIVEGKTAALLEQERADIFTQQIGNIPPRETVVARITIDQRLVWLPEGEWELRFPTVIGPRYVGSADTVADVLATHIKVADQPLSSRIQIELAIRDAVVAGAKPSSPTHQLVHKAGAVELISGARLDRDIVVRWPVATPAVGLSLASARPDKGDDAYGLLTVVPPARTAQATPVARDLIVLLDTSGSMGGGPLDKAKQVVALLIGSLGEHDRLELVEFSNTPRRYKDEPITATPKAKADAIKWVHSRSADGGTEMRAAVVEALATLRVGAQRQVIVVTDGYVGGEQQILDALHRTLPKSCRLHVLGVGAAVNRSLASSLARAGCGVEVIVGLDEDAERGAKRLLDRTKLPMLTNVEIAGSALVRHAPERVPDVFEGAPLVAALLLHPHGGELVVTGQLADSTWRQTLQVPAHPAGEGNQAIVALFGRERVADIEAHAMFSSVDGEIEDLGLMYQIATRMTSWIAIDESRRSTGPSRDELVPQELVHGTSAQAFGLRAAAPMQVPAGRAVMRDVELDALEEEADGGDYLLARFDEGGAGAGGAADAKTRVARSAMIATRAPAPAPAAPRRPAPESEQAKRAVPREQGELAAPHMQAPREVGDAIAKPSPIAEPSVIAGAASTGTSVPKTELARKGKLELEAEPVAPAKPRRLARWIAILAAVIALIAALVWWLLA
jgi:Ca-activated chloride channel homolog